MSEDKGVSYWLYALFEQGLWHDSACAFVRFTNKVSWN